MAVAARIDPKTYFTPEEWAPLSRRSRWTGLALVAHAWIVIGLAMAMAVVWQITIPLAIAIIGARQLGLAIMMHDAGHGALHPNLKVNDWVGDHLTTGGANTDVTAAVTGTGLNLQLLPHGVGVQTLVVSAASSTAGRPGFPG